jgi:hypothetical protein
MDHLDKTGPGSDYRFVDRSLLQFTNASIKCIQYAKDASTKCSAAVASFVRVTMSKRLMFPLPESTFTNANADHTRRYQCKLDVAGSRLSCPYDVARCFMQARSIVRREEPPGADDFIGTTFNRNLGRRIKRGVANKGKQKLYSFMSAAETRSEGNGRYMSRDSAALIYAWAWVVRRKPPPNNRRVLPWDMKTREEWNCHANAAGTEMSALISDVMFWSSPPGADAASHMTFIVEMLMMAYELVSGSRTVVLFMTWKIMRLKQAIAMDLTLARRGDRTRNPTRCILIDVLLRLRARMSTKIKAMEEYEIERYTASWADLSHK